MKAPGHILAALVAAVVGYGVGTISKVAHHPAADEGVGASSSTSATQSPSAGEAALTEVMSALLNRGNLRELARLGALLDALDASQMHALLERVEGLPSTDREVFFHRLLGYWTKRDPQAATEWMQPRLTGYAKDDRFANGFANFETDLVNTWAQNAPELALEFARQHSGTGLSRIILHSAIFAWPDKDYRHRFDLLRDFPPGPDRQKVVVSLCFSWAQMNRTAALASASTLPPGAERDGALAEILSRWAAHEPADAFTKAQSFGISDPAVLGVMTKEAAKSHPVATAGWLRTQDPALVAQVGPVLATFWAEDDPAAAFAWALEHGISLTDPASRNARNIPGDLFPGHCRAGRAHPLFRGATGKAEGDASLGPLAPSGPRSSRYLELAARESR